MAKSSNAKDTVEHVPSEKRKEGYPSQWKEHMKDALPSGSGAKSVKSEGSIFTVSERPQRRSKSVPRGSGVNNRIIHMELMREQQELESEKSAQTPTSLMTPAQGSRASTVTTPQYWTPVVIPAGSVSSNNQSVTPDSSISTIGSAHFSDDTVTLITDSQTSDYTTETSHETSSGSFTISRGPLIGNAQILPYAPLLPGSLLREIHVGVSANFTVQQLEVLSGEVHRLLAREMLLMRQAGGSSPVIYLVAYHYM